MALTLTAEQKSIYDIFSGNSKYVIPPYQRAYSWDEEQCSEFFEDIKNSFLDNEGNEGYFIGNIVIAKSSEEKNLAEVIDGQQRLITLTLFLKALMILNMENRDLEKSIWLENRNRNIKEKEQRVKTRVFEDKDSKFLKEALEIDFEKDCKNNDNNFIINICFFYKELKLFSEKNSIEDFSNYLLDNVTLLPIESTDTDQNRAREKALKIFETINNRGRPLSDSDIFKANLYSMALNSLEHKKFIDRWKKLDFECDNIKLNGFDIVRIFKIYSYVIRAENRDKSSEIGLRNFFMKKDYSPFKTKTYNEIMDELFNILKAIKIYELIIIDTKENNQLSKWFQLIDIYTNNYPKDLLILYLYKNLEKKKDSYLNFAKNLVRYCYFQGSTTKIKYFIYTKMVDIILNKNNIVFPQCHWLNEYENLGKLYKGYGLLYTYLQDDIKAIYPYKIKRLRDVTSFRYPNYSTYNRIGHTVVTDTHENILEKYNFKSFNEKIYLERFKNIKNTFISFFGDSSND